MSFQRSVDGLLRVYRGLGLLTNTSAVDPSRERLNLGKATHGSMKTSRPLGFRGELPPSVEMEEALGRFVQVWERRLDEHSRGRVQTASGDRRSTARKAEDDAILREAGRDATEVAYLYGRTTEGVRKMRGRRGFDPDTGERIVKDNLTAPPPRRDEPTEGIA